MTVLAHQHRSFAGFSARPARPTYMAAAPAAPALTPVESKWDKFTTDVKGIFRVIGKPLKIPYHLSGLSSVVWLLEKYSFVKDKAWEIILESWQSGKTMGGHTLRGSLALPWADVKAMGLRQKALLWDAPFKTFFSMPLELLRAVPKVPGLLWERAKARVGATRQQLGKALDGVLSLADDPLRPLTHPWDTAMSIPRGMGEILNAGENAFAPIGRALAGPLPHWGNAAGYTYVEQLPKGWAKAGNEFGGVREAAVNWRERIRDIFTSPPPAPATPALAGAR